MKVVTARAMLALLAGCGAAAPGGNGATAAAAPDPMEANIAALSDSDRKLAFFRAIYDADYQCDQIVKLDTRPRDAGKPVWLATCDDDGEYVITLQPGGIFTVSGVKQPRRRMPKSTVILPVGTK